jgi:hypothetical protein
MIKLTVASCRRMWARTIVAQCQRTGRMWPYQSQRVKRYSIIKDSIEQKITARLKKQLSHPENLSELE